MRAPSFHSDPHIQFLSQLLEDIGEGGLQVPRFQRPLVWDWERRIELLRSIRDGIPIGAIMVWRTSTVKIDCYDRLGPHLLQRPAENATRQYILDGVQRLSTLYGALHRPQVAPPPLQVEFYEQAGESPTDTSSGEETGPFDVFFDPETKDFVSPEVAAASFGPLMPISLAFDSVALLRFQRQLAEAGHEEAIQAIDKLARAFREYKIPIIPITTDDVNLATRTFQRINSQGARMTEAHMIHALTWNPNFDLQTRVSDARQAHLEEVGWGGLDDDVILKSCKASFGLDVYKTNAEDFSEALLSHPNALEGVVRSIRSAADFLNEQCGVPSPELTPYALQIVVLSEAFRTAPALSERVAGLLVSWFWMTTYGELFAGMSGDRVQVALHDMQSTVWTEMPVWTWKRPFEERPLRKTFDFRAARAKAFAFRLADLQNHFYGNRHGSRLIASQGRKALFQAIPWTKQWKSAYSSPGNRFLVPQEVIHDFRESLLSGYLSETDLLAHGLTDSIIGHARMGDFDRFVEERLKHINEMEHNFVTPMALAYGAKVTFADSSSAIENVLRNEWISVIHSNGKDHFVIFLGSISTPITIKLFPRGDEVWFDVSHAIKTPLQAGPYWTSRPYEEGAGPALRRAVSGLVDYYREATARGFEPNASWLYSRES